jgi:tetratricopeptide (TPR) repeat protein
LLSWIAVAEEAYAEAQRWSQEAFTVAQATGEQNLCLPITTMGFVERGLGNRRQAREHYGEALRTAIQRGASIFDLQWVGALAALLLADEGNAERALELYTLLSGHPHVANSQWFEDFAGKHIAAVAVTLPPDVVAAAQARGRARDLQATLKELLDELEG